MKSSTSLRAQILKYGFLALALSVAIVAVISFLNFSALRKRTLEFEASKMMNSGEKQAERLVPGLLISEEYGSIELQLKQVIQQENLVGARFVPESSATAALYSSCVDRPNGYVCIDNKNAKIKTIEKVLLAGTNLGFLVKEKNVRFDHKDDLFESVSYALIGSAIVFLIMVITLLLFVERQVRKPILALQRGLLPVLNESDGSIATNFSVSELQELATQVQILASRFGEKKLAAAKGELATQVAHDIRSPLSLLRMLVQQAHGLTGEEKRLLGMVSERISKIADGLVSGYASRSINETKTCLVLPTITTIVEEKIAAYQEPKIELNIDTDAAFTCISSDGVELGRAVSNLIDNAREASSKTSKSIKVNISAEAGYLSIVIVDFGCGLPANLVKRVGQRGESFGKANGHGLGVYQARIFAESLGGSFQFSSILGYGTEVTLTLPIGKLPYLIATQNELMRFDRFVVVDDDSGMHDLWRKLLGSKVIACFDSLRKFDHKLLLDDDICFLIDENISVSDSGLDFILGENLKMKSILVTNSYEDPRLIKRLLTSSVYMLPKVIVPYISISSLKFSELVDTYVNTAL